MRTNLDFSRNLVKGHIAETIFEQMIREEDGYTVFHFGYEHTLPMLAQYRKTIKEVDLEKISNAPDFVLISNDRQEAYLVEVKYRSDLNKTELKKIAKQLLSRWGDCWLFVCTPKGFYCSPCKTTQFDGHVSKLSERWVSKKRQKAYLELLNEFLKK